MPPTTLEGDLRSAAAEWREMCSTLAQIRPNKGKSEVFVALSDNYSIGTNNNQQDDPNVASETNFCEVKHPRPTTLLAQLKRNEGKTSCCVCSVCVR